MGYGGIISKGGVSVGKLFATEIIAEVAVSSTVIGCEKAGVPSSVTFALALLAGVGIGTVSNKVLFKDYGIKIDDLNLGELGKGGSDLVDDVIEGGITSSIGDTAKETVTGEDWCRYLREEYGVNNVVWENATPSQLARSWQGVGKYPGIDVYEDISISKGKIIYRGEPNGTEYFTTKEAIEGCNRNATNIFEGLQVRKDPVRGYRGNMQGYIVNEDLAAVYGITNTNPQFGKGGLPQMFIPDAQELINKSVLIPVDNIPLVK